MKKYCNPILLVITIFSVVIVTIIVILIVNHFWDSIPIWERICVIITPIIFTTVIIPYIIIHVKEKLDKSKKLLMSSGQGGGNPLV